MTVTARIQARTRTGRRGERTLRVDAALQVRHLGEPRHDLRARPFMQLRGRAGLIDMAVIQQDHLDVGRS